MTSAPYLIVPSRRKFIIAEEPIAIRPRLQGWIRLRAMRPDGRYRMLADWFPNLILDQGLNFLATSGMVSRMAAGTGNTAPAVGQTQLVTQAGTQVSNIISNTHSRQSSAPYFGSRFWEFQSSIGQITGNLAEIGFGPPSSDPLQLANRALILDGGGSPTTITVLSDEALNANLELRLYPPTADVTGSISLDGVSRDYTIRAQEVDDTVYWSQFIGDSSLYSGGSWSLATGPLGATIDLPTTGVGAINASVTPASYTPSNFYLDATGFWGLGLGQPGGGIGAISLSTKLGRFGIDFDPVLDKPTNKTLSLTFRLAWSRHS